MRQCANGSTSSNESGAGTEHAGLAVRAERVVDLARFEDVEHPAVREREVRLDVVGLPLVGDGLDADAGEPDIVALVPDPDVHRFPHLGIVRLLREHELPIHRQSAAQIDTHLRPPSRPR